MALHYSSPSKLIQYSSYRILSQHLRAYNNTTLDHGSLRTTQVHSFCRLPWRKLRSTVCKLVFLYTVMLSSLFHSSTKAAISQVFNFSLPAFQLKFFPTKVHSFLVPNWIRMNIISRKKRH